MILFWLKVGLIRSKNWWLKCQSKVYTGYQLHLIKNGI